MASNLVLGYKTTRIITLTEQHINTYTALTGDYNPLHFDVSFATQTKFGRLVVKGGLTTGLLNALVAMDNPGPGTIFLSQNWNFTAPVYFGDTITAEDEMLSVHESKLINQMGFKITRQDGETILERVSWCFTFSPDE